MNNSIKNSEFLNCAPKKPLSDLLTTVTGVDFGSLSSEQILEMADGFLDTPIPFMTLSSYRACVKEGLYEPFEAKYRERRKMLLCLIFAEARDKKGKYIDKICDLFWAISEETCWVLPRNASVSPTAPLADVPEILGRETLHGIDSFSLGTAAIFAAIYKAGLKSAIAEISDILPERVEAEIAIRCATPFLNLGLSEAVSSPEANAALDYVANSGILPEDTREAITAKLRTLSA